MACILAFIFGLSNAFRGGNYVSRLLSVLIMGIAYAAYLLVTGHGIVDTGVSGVIAFGTLWPGLLLGWQLSAITGRYNPEEKNFWLADKIGNWVYEKTGSGYDAGIAHLSARAVLFYPFFAIMGIWTGSDQFFIWGWLVLLMGPIYYLSGCIGGEKHGTRIAEFIYFAIIGMVAGGCA